MKNGRNKGKVGEREFAAFLREQGFGARRGQQFAGSAESPDVVCDGLPWLHIEVKRVEKLNLLDACVQAEGDCGGKRWIVAHRRNHGPWLVTLRAEVFCEMARELGPEGPSGERVGRGESEQVRKWESGNAAWREPAPYLTDKKVSGRISEVRRGRGFQ